MTHYIKKACDHFRKYVNISTCMSTFRKCVNISEECRFVNSEVVVCCCKMNDFVTTFQCIANSRFITDISKHISVMRRFITWLNKIENDNFITAVHKFTAKISPDKTGTTSDYDFLFRMCHVMYVMGDFTHGTSVRKAYFSNFFAF